MIRRDVTTHSSRSAASARKCPTSTRRGPGTRGRGPQSRIGRWPMCRSGSCASCRVTATKRKSSAGERSRSRRSARLDTSCLAVSTRSRAGGRRRNACTRVFRTGRIAGSCTLVSRSRACGPSSVSTKRRSVRWSRCYARKPPPTGSRCTPRRRWRISRRISTESAMIRRQP